MNNFWVKLVSVITWFILLKINLLLPFVSSSSSSTIDSIENGRWNTTLNGKILWRNDCEFDYSYVFSYTVKEPVLTAEECGKQCLTRPMTCNHFIQNSAGNCDLLWATKATKPLEVLSDKSTCGYIPSQVWPKSEEDDRILVKSNCTFQSTASDELEVSYVRSFHLCKSGCLEEHLCSAFSYNEKDRHCIMPHKAKAAKKISNPWILEELFRSNISTVSSSSSNKCAIVSTRAWELYDPRTFYQYNCDFNGFDIIALNQNKSRENCIYECSDNPNCTHFSFHHKNNGACFLKKARLLTADRVDTEDVICGYIPDKIKWNFTTKNGWVIRWKEECDFELNNMIKSDIKSAEDCQEECVKLDTCNHFSHDGVNCYLMLNFELSKLKTINGKQWTCGYVPRRIWHRGDRSKDDARILIKTECAINPSSSYYVINEKSLTKCQQICLYDHRCNAFSFNSADSKCVLPHKKSEFEATIISYSNFTQLVRLFGRLDVDSWTSECGFIPNRNWNIDRIGSVGDGILYQDKCNFNNEFNIEEPIIQMSFDDCIAHCFKLAQCTHFTYKDNGMCSVKKASALADRLTEEKGRKCGYIPSRWNLTENETQENYSTYIIRYRIITILNYIINKPNILPI